MIRFGESLDETMVIFFAGFAVGDGGVEMLPVSQCRINPAADKKSIPKIGKVTGATWNAQI